MKIAHFTSETFGGAGIAAERLHRGLLQRGIDSRFYFDKGDCFAAGAERHRAASKYWLRIKADLIFGLRHRLNKKGASLFTSPRGARHTPLSLFGGRPDIINLHWVARWLDIPSFFRSLPVNRPIVWSLHDMNPFTGGCHLWTGCERFMSGCHDCPHLRFAWRWDASARYFAAKERAYRGRRLHVIGNSQWTTAQAKRSHLLRDAGSFDTIPLGLDTDEYTPVEKETARAALKLPKGDFVIGFGCADLSDKNKNFSGLLAALRALPDKRGLVLVAFGGGRPPEMPDDLPTLFLGHVASARLQSVFYSALDVFVMPSRMETFGLTALEAMACGTPVVAYRTGGIPDFVEDKIAGLLAPDIESPSGLTERLEWMQKHPAERHQMGLAARLLVEKSFTVRLMAERYLKTYQKILSDQPSQTERADKPTTA